MGSALYNVPTYYLQECNQPPKQQSAEGVGPLPELRKPRPREVK